MDRVWHVVHRPTQSGGADLEHPDTIVTDADRIDDDESEELSLDKARALLVLDA
ncbi:hypothetical protein MNVM_42070 [Mycobacterium novum]|uniref:Uncharacterized protein n=1 Tax=Mycobacterium novum TaxID=2492438 RepID=A0A7I7JTE0_9MYCO|nr:hypothetical protein MNVM_42070 [Mycobacterium novum]